MKTIVITGSTSGIGQALLKSFIGKYKVLAGYRREECANNLESLGAIPFYINMSDKNSIRRASTFIKSNTEKIDVLINVAGCVVAGAVEQIDTDRIREQFEVNTFSHLEFTQSLLDLLDGGKIINISSMSSFGIFPFVAPYCASKRALDILFNCMQLETKRNIRIVSVKPGVIATPLWEKSIKNNENEISNTHGFDAEMKYMVANAESNGKNGLPVEKVVDLINEIVMAETPKSSYTVGLDAKVAELISKLPQDWINFIVKAGLKLKLAKQKETEF